MDLRSSADSSSTRHSPTYSFSADSTNSSITSVEAYEFLPPIRSPSPLRLSGEKPTTNMRSHHNSSDGERMHVRPETLEKPLPNVPISIFDRLQSPSSFHPTRRAPLPPFAHSWIDLSDDEDDDSSFNSSTRRTAPPTVPLPVPPQAASPSVDDPAAHRIEKEIMRMLQFNEEREVDKRIDDRIDKKVTRRKSALNLGGFMGKLRRSVSIKGPNEYNNNKRVSYFDFMM
jgi:hypothetical protein